MSDKAISDLRWKNAVIYCLDVELFADGNGDGIGDFPGLTDCVDYLAGLGVTCPWLMLFYPTPNRDNGYDIADYYGVDLAGQPPGDVVELLRTARERGIRVLADLVVNHTSVDYPVPGGLGRPALALPRLLRSGPIERPPTGPRTSSSPARRPPTGSSTSAPASGTCNFRLQEHAGPEHRQPQGPRRDPPARPGPA